MTEARLDDILDNTCGFDGRWYAETHPDVALSGLPPRLHFLRYGHHMGRGVSAGHPRLASLPDLATALARQPVISYCIPVMNRGDDLRGTLGQNLEENAAFRAEIEFIVMFYDDDRTTHDWIRTDFADALADGYLRMIVAGPLDGWHFGKAKNGFRDHLRGAVYSSLDGDNFVTTEETRQLRDTHAAHPEGFVFHHFTGTWGDGSSGRVSLPRRLYRRVGYDGRMLPRQFDEIDLMLSSLLAAPQAPLVHYAAGDTGTHGLSSKRTAGFMAEAGIANRTLSVAPVRRMVPLNPKEASYVSDDAELLAMQTFNQALSFHRNAPSAKLRRKYLDMVFEARHALVDTLPPDLLLSMLFHGADIPGGLEIGAEEVCLFACVKDDDAYLDAFHAHYARLGVTRFFLVDDESAQPVAERLRHPGVHVLRPKTGRFATAKGLWLGALIAAVLRPGMWALTVDADEFLDLPDGVESLPALTARSAAAGAEFVPGVLVDMLPRADLPLDAPDRVAAEFATLFPDHCAMPPPPSADYAAHHAVAWGFGAHAEISWRVDARFHAFGTVDSLRKLPLLRHRPGRHLNQGFHNFHTTDGSPQPDPKALWTAPHILPVRHYKLAKIFTGAGAGAAAQAGAYHARTAGNIARIFGLAPAEALERLAGLPRQPYSDGALRYAMTSPHTGEQQEA